MNTDKPVDFTTYYRKITKQQQKNAWLLAGGVMLFSLGIGAYSKAWPAFLLAAIGLLLIYILHQHYTRKYSRRLALINKAFPNNWHQYLEDNAAFYANLNPAQKQQFQTRVQFFWPRKKLRGLIPI